MINVIKMATTRPSWIVQPILLCMYEHYNINRFTTKYKLMVSNHHQFKVPHIYKHLIKRSAILTVSKRYFEYINIKFFSYKILIKYSVILTFSKWYFEYISTSLYTTDRRRECNYSLDAGLTFVKLHISHWNIWIYSGG